MPELNPFFARVLAQEAPGGPAARLHVVAPSRVEVGQPFAVKLSALDHMGLPSVECDGVIRAHDAAAFGLPSEIRCDKAQPAVHQIDGVRIEQAGLHRLAFDLAGETFLSNPIQARPEPGERLWWGDPHVHTILSRCHWERCRSLNFCYICARHVIGLDWAAAADHVSNGRSDASKWKAERTAARLFDDPPHFATLLAYEASLQGGCGGDNNVYFRDDADAWVDAYEDGDTATLADRLGDQDFIIVPHHTTRTGKHGELSDRTYLGPRLMPVVEIHSKWGTGEHRGNLNPLHKIHPGPCYAQDFLAQGYELGFIAGTDTHCTMPSGFGNDSSHIDRLPGLTAVFAPELSRQSVYDGMKRRACYGTSLERIIVDGTIAGLPMGTRLVRADAGAPRRAAAFVAAESDIVRVDVVRNGEAVFSQPGAGWHMELAWTDEEALASIALDPTPAQPRPFVYYYFRVTCASGAQAWTSPVWLCVGP